MQFVKNYRKTNNKWLTILFTLLRTLWNNVKLCDRKKRWDKNGTQKQKFQIHFVLIHLKIINKNIQKGEYIFRNILVNKKYLPICISYVNKTNITVKLKNQSSFIFLIFPFAEFSFSNEKGNIFFNSLETVLFFC